MNEKDDLQDKITIYQDTVLKSTGRYFCRRRQFALPTTGNSVTWMKSGEEALASIYEAFSSAEKFIWIADWQMAHDVELIARGSNDHAARLHKVFADIISRNPVQIRILLYKSIFDSQPGTYDGLVASRLNKLNKKHYPGKIIVLCQDSTSAQYDKYEYSHHQKFAVIDGKIGFIGGIDLSYGRYDTTNYDVVIDPQRYVVNEMYNPCAVKLRGMSPSEAELVGIGFEKPYGGTLLDEGCQPRMPWQDVHIRIEGPATIDIHRNFVRRWNMVARDLQRRLQESKDFVPRQPKIKDESESLPHEIDDEWLTNIAAIVSLKDAAKRNEPAKAIVQIVRSVSSTHLKLESQLLGKFSIPQDIGIYADDRLKAAMSDGIEKWRIEHQANIMEAMEACIDSADNYVYIESQFFISNFGVAKTHAVKKNGPRTITIDANKIGNEDDGIKNRVLDALGRRIEHHVTAGTNFHVYLVFPVHPEGHISNDETWKQHWLALASICLGSESLIGRTQEALKKVGKPVNDWKKYITVLNMRNYGVAVQYARDPKTFREDYTREIGRYVITEQVYIHSKILIVDDAVAIVGSANCNDRSLTGNGDTELAAVVVDTEGVESRDLGNSQFKAVTRKFARELRRGLWRKHFGFDVNVDAYFDSTERARRSRILPHPLPSGLHPPRVTMTEDTLARYLSKSGIRTSFASILEKPCDPVTVRAIQAIADGNAGAYEAVFTHTPRNSMSGFQDGFGCYTRPYPATVSGEVRDEVISRKMTYSTEATPAFPSRHTELELEKAKQVADTNFERSMHAIEAKKRVRHLGVIPPALQPQFMTTELESYQVEGRKASMDKFHERQVVYDGEKIHALGRTISYLKDNVIGFFVAAPLNWGHDARVDSDVAKKAWVGVDLAENSSKESGEATRA
mgnify:CR=1 FL=1